MRDQRAELRDDRSMAGTMTTTAVLPSAPNGPPPYSREAVDVIASLGSDEEQGLSSAEASNRLAQYGPNEIAKEKPPSIWQVALAQLRDPMNIMLIAVTA